MFWCIKFVRTAEQLGKNQLSLFEEEATTEPEEENAAKQEEEKQKIQSYSRKKPGRKAIDPDLPRVEETLDIPESEKFCACGEKMTRIGEETSEKLEIIPQSIFVIKTIRPKYACRCCEGTEGKPAVRLAPVAPAIIPRSIASASVLSCIFVQKFQDHLPYYRQEVQFERIGVEISRQDMSNWQQQVYKHLEPVFDLMKSEGYEEPLDISH